MIENIKKLIKRMETSKDDITPVQPDYDTEYFEKKLEELNKRFNKLKEEYPEEFL